jgi:hypothetical protein
MRVVFGATGNAATVGLPTISTDGTYIGRDIATNGTAFGVRFNVGATGSVTINYVRRVLESGQTNPGEGTIVQWVNLPWNSSVVPNSTVIPIETPGNTSGSFVFLSKDSGGNYTLNLSDGVNVATVAAPATAGRVVAIPQFSAALGRMRIGIYNPTTGTLTWSRATLAGGKTYRGFFPIHASNRLRWFYGGGNYPIGVGPMLWFNAPIPDDPLIWAAREVQP